MKNFIWVSLCLFGLAANAESYSGYAPFPRIGNQAIERVWSRLQACGLIRMSAFDPRLPPPSVPAQEAVVSPRGQLLAYYMENYGAGFSAGFKNPNGGYNHSVSYTNGNIRFVTPYEGVVVHGNTFAMVGGVGTNLYCASTPVPYQVFLDCIEARWVNRITGQLCPYGGG